MSERFERIFSLTGNQYAENSPLIISAGALLKDTETGKILAQLKFKSISPEPIKAIKVKITPMDTIGKPIGNEVLFDYLDLNEKRDAEFGQKKPIPMPNPATRSFTAEVTEVAFTNNTVWSASENNTWNSLEALVPLDHALGDHEVVKQYRMRFGANAKYQPQRDNGLWRCTCGAVNNAQEENCHACGCAANALFTCNYEELKAESTVRVEQEREAEKKESKKRKKIAAIIIPAVIICIAAFVLYSKVLVPSRNYNHAVTLLEDGQYESAIAAFEALGDYKDSAEQVEVAKLARIEEINSEKYIEAERLLAAGKYDAAIKAFRELGSYRDSPQRITEIENTVKYENAEHAISTGDYYSAYRILVTLDGSYKDTSRLISELREQHPFACVEKGDIILFGSYEQDNNLANGQEPIEWIVIETSADEISLYSKYILDMQRFSAVHPSTYTNGSPAPETYYVGIKSSWEGTSLYKWLNDSFYSAAFTAKEKRLLTGPVSLLTLHQAYELSESEKTFLLTDYARSLFDDELHHVWLALDAIKYFSNKSEISTGALNYWSFSGYSITKENYTNVTNLGGVRPLIVLDPNS